MPHFVNERTLFETVRTASWQVEDGRTVDYVFKYLQGEVDELEAEVVTLRNQVTRPQSKTLLKAIGITQGKIINEGCDVISCVIDLMLLVEPDLTEKQVAQVMYRKMRKWVRQKQSLSHVLSQRVCKLCTMDMPVAERRAELRDILRRACVWFDDKKERAALLRLKLCVSDMIERLKKVKE